MGKWVSKWTTSKVLVVTVLLGLGVITEPQPSTASFYPA